MEDFIAEAENLVEEIIDFPARPGGMIDRHRQEKARREAQAKEREQEQERQEEHGYKAVKTVLLSPEVISAITYNIAPGANAPVLPQSPYRYRATLIVVTAASTAILAKDAGAALGGVGFSLPSGIPLPLFTRAQLWAFNPGAAAIQVSVLTEIYSPEA